MIEQAVSLLGAAMVLAAYAANQTGRLDRRGLPYLLLNLFGAVILTVFAVRARQMGLILMEAAWVAISLAALLARPRGPSRTA